MQVITEMIKHHNAVVPGPSASAADRNGDVPVAC